MSSRLSQSEVGPETFDPVLLSKNSKFTKLLLIDIIRNCCIGELILTFINKDKILGSSSQTHCIENYWKMPNLHKTLCETINQRTEKLSTKGISKLHLCLWLEMILVDLFI